MKSNTLSIYKTWLATATPKQIAFVDEVFALCERNYEAGGDRIVECYSPADIVKEFKTLRAVRARVGLHNSQAADARWGDDTDPEVNKPQWKD
jgi:hypothetical protein